MSEKNLLIQKRGRVKGSISRIKTFAEGITANTPSEDIAIRLDKLREAWTEFCEVEDSLLLIQGQTSEMEEYENKYFEAKSLLLRALKARNSPRTDNDQSMDLNATIVNLMQQQQSFLENLDRTNEGSATTRLPRLNIPFFSGDYKEWLSFQDLFEAAVHRNNSLSSSQKFQYLKGLLKGNAANLIRHLSISDSNYDEAWAKLKERFDKKSHIITGFIKTYLDQPQLNQPSIKGLRNMCDLSDEVIRGLKALGPNAERRDPWLIHIALTKLDADTREQWSKEASNIDLPSFDEFLKFLNKRCDALETCINVSKRTSTQVKSLHIVPAEIIPTCPKCDHTHSLSQCQAFKTDPPSVRKSFIVSHSLCFKCLSPTHSVRFCRSRARCNHCKGNHHSLLHDPADAKGSKIPPTAQVSSSISQPPQTSDSSINTISAITPTNTSLNSTINSNQFLSAINPNSSSQESTAFPSINSSVEHHPPAVLQSTSGQNVNPSILPTAIVNIPDSQGRLQPCRALLDSGSQVTLISESCVQRLSLKRENARVVISGLSASEAGVTRGKVELSIYSRLNVLQKLDVLAFVMTKLTSLIPADRSSSHCLSDFGELPLADPYFYVPSTVDVIIGSDHFFEVLLPGKKRDPKLPIFAQETIFGWVLSGSMQSNLSSLVNYHTEIALDLDRALSRFWEIEEIQPKVQRMTDEEAKYELHFINTFCRDSTGRYTVSLPFKDNNLSLGESKQNAISRLYTMERRFAKDVSFKEQYVKFMREYEDLNHLERIPLEEVNVDAEKSFYLPHHAVFKNTPERKIRVVFDGSCKSHSGVSLNEKLMVGPTIQRDIISILVNFRKFAIGFSADLEKMYRQVSVSPTDRDFQRIVWREDATAPIQHYRLKTVTYGTASAPFLATRVLKQIAKDNETLFPEASTIIQTGFYVDDLLSGADTLITAIKLKEDLTQLFHEAGFNLTKWRSNSLEFLRSKQINIQKPNLVHIDDLSGISKILGIQWDAQKDEFLFHLSSFNIEKCTKRSILSASSRIFDPLGWLAPIIIVIKIMFQQLWLTSLGWDDSLPQEMQEKWHMFTEQLSSMQSIRIPRRIFLRPDSIEFHGFSDASEKAYAAVLYCRSFDSEGNIVVRIVSSKTKVSPLRQITLPRLELCAALLLARLIDKVVKALSMVNTKIYAWTDSSIVLGWLSDIPRRWKTFVANRTSEILETIPGAIWRYVPSGDNPADWASRGVSPQELQSLDFRVERKTRKIFFSLKYFVIVWITCLLVYILSPGSFKNIYIFFYAATNTLKSFHTFIMKRTK